jgi:hypothetical protein
VLSKGAENKLDGLARRGIVLKRKVLLADLLDSTLKSGKEEVMADAACTVDEYLTNISASVSEATSTRLPKPRRILALVTSYLHYHSALFRIRKYCRIALSCLSSIEEDVEGGTEVLQRLHGELGAVNLGELSDFFRKIDSFALRYPLVRNYHSLIVKRLQRQIYGMLDDLTSFLESYLGEDGDFISGDELLAKMG